MAILSIRDQLAKVLEDALGENFAIEVRRWIPADLFATPVVVIGRPSMTFEGSRLGIDTECVVHVFGRKLHDDDAQAELDTLADYTVDLLLAGQVAISTVQPYVETISGQLYPSYQITCSTSETYC